MAKGHKKKPIELKTETRFKRMESPIPIDVPIDYANVVIRQWNFAMFMSYAHPFSANLHNFGIHERVELVISSDWRFKERQSFEEAERTLHIVPKNRLVQDTLEAYFQSFCDWLERLERSRLLHLDLTDIGAEDTERVLCAASAWNEHPRDWDLALHPVEHAQLLDGTKTKSKPAGFGLRQQWVYFIQAEGHPKVKIGVTSNIDARLSQLQTSSPFPLKVLAVIAGDRDTEKRIHQRFQPYRVSGEWFSLEGELKTFIKQLLFLKEDL